MKHTKCEECGTPIVFIRTSGGKFMPCDDCIVYYKQSAEGSKTFITPNGETIKGEQVNPQEENVTGVESHIGRRAVNPTDFAGGDF